MSQAQGNSHAAVADKDWNAVLARLRADGFSPVESIKVTRAVLEVSLGEAKRIVHESQAWSDARESFEGVQDAAFAAAEKYTA
jgi:ribosomal protein L7/L12